MTKRFFCSVVLTLCSGALALGCSSNSGSPMTLPSAGTTAVGGGAGRIAASGGAGSTSIPSGIAGQSGTFATAGTISVIAGTSASSGTGGHAGSTVAGSGGSSAVAGASGHSAGTGGSGGTSVAGTGGGAGGTSGSGAGSLTGTLGALGPIQPLMNGWATTNGPETLIYLTTAKLTCADMMTMGVKWLSKLPAGSQVIEIVIPGTATVKTYPIAAFQGEVNYAEGSKSSSSEVVGRTGMVVFSKADAKAVFEGTITVSAPFTLMGSFHAEWCQGGSEF